MEVIIAKALNDAEVTFLVHLNKLLNLIYQI